jgi:hypothetical protein
MEPLIWGDIDAADCINGSSIHDAVKVGGRPDRSRLISLPSEPRPQSDLRFSVRHRRIALERFEGAFAKRGTTKD